MFPSDPGLRLFLTSLGLVSSLFKPTPTLVIEGAGPTLGGSTTGVVTIGCDPGFPMGCGGVAAETLTLPNTAETLRNSTTVALPSPSPVLHADERIALSAKAQQVSCVVEPYESPIAFTQTFPPFDEARANIFRYRQQQGVNLGSWFVHEQWMTPSLFTCASGNKSSELDIASGWGSVVSARALLERHWDTFITADDFKYLASIGINTARLPIGYWNLGPLYCRNTPFEPVSDVYQNSWAHIVKTINMAAEAGIGILVDLHGAPGSQNGQAHSGISDGQANLFSNTAYQTQTISVLTFLTQQLASVTNVVGIEILNEPKNVAQLTGFYTSALATLRQVSPQAANFPFYIHDGFDLQRFSDYVSARQDFVVQDHHSYFVFTPNDSAESADGHTKDIAQSIAQSFANASQSQRNNLVIAEWSCALSPQSLSQVQDPEGSRRRFCREQMQVYQNSTAGWSFWSYNKEGCNSDEGWCFKNAVGKALPSTFFSYTGQSASGTVPTPAVLTALLNMHLPEASTILTRVAQEDSVLEEFAPEMINAEVLIRSTANKSRILGRRGHRYMTVHSRRQSSALTLLSPSQQAAIKGYSDGFLTAKIFAVEALSRLAFTGQYIEDSLRSLNPAIGEEQMDFYRKWFRKGLTDGESLIRSIVLVT